ncbi:hypothetical protein N9B31_09035 [Mariniblastus sp.]|nr:hypothetical protein [Mariniblastus sp.]
MVHSPTLTFLLAFLIGVLLKVLGDGERTPGPNEFYLRELVVNVICSGAEPFNDIGRERFARYLGRDNRANLVGDYLGVFFAYASESNESAFLVLIGK